MRPNLRTFAIALEAMTAFLLLATTTPAWAQGSNTTNPAPTPSTPAPVTTSLPQLSSVNAGGCAQQYTNAINAHNQNAAISNDVGLAANATAAAATVTGLIAQEVAATASAAEFTAMAAGLGVTVAYGVAPLPTAGGIPGSVAAAAAAGALAATGGVEAVALGAAIVGAGANVTGVASQIAAQVYTHSALSLTEYVATLPNCDSEFTGTVKVSAGGVDVTGASIFNDDVGVAADVNVEGDVNGSQVHATQGISAVGGGIWIGDPNGTTFSSGITIGGGALSGAGVGGAQAFTGDVDAIAVGNNAHAMMSGSLALGLDSSSTGTDAIAIGNAAAANGEQDVVVGAFNNTDAGGNNTVVGNENDIIGGDSSNNTVLGVGHQVTGSGNFVGGDPNTIIGSLNAVTGAGSNVTGDSNVAVGDTVNISGNRAIAVGNNATANADDTTAIGTNAQANAAGSAAFGQGAVASQPQQQVFGTKANTYTAPGITSSQSRARQVGAVEVATSDANGNLATDGSVIFEALSEHEAGIAIAMALESPSLQAGETFGVAVNWGIFNQSQALAFSAIGVVARDVFLAGDRIALNGGFGLSVKAGSFGGHRTGTAAGGRAGVQFAW